MHGEPQCIAANGVIFARTYDKQTRQGTIVALAADTLETVWSMTGTFSIWSMAVANGRLYVVGVKDNDNWVCAFGNE